MLRPVWQIGPHFASAWHAVLLAAVLSGMGLCAPPASAATIDIETTTIDGQRVSFITVEGELKPGDEARFVDLAIGLPGGAVLFNSPGGDLNAGIEIGKAIRLKGFATMAIDAYSCASACALAWLGGMTRFMGEDYAIGFHAVYLASDPNRQADSVGNALVGAYLNQLGMTPQAIAYMTEVQPNGMRWMSFEDAQAVAITVLPLDPPDETVDSRDPEPAAPDDWASYGEWIQIYSRQSYREAVDLAGDFHREFPDTFVFRYDNGWYVGAIGPFPFGRARPERDRLIRLGRIPRDSLVNRGDRFVDLVWGVSPERPSVASVPTDESLALDAAYAFFAATSRSRAEALGYLTSIYSPEVEYFGKRIARAEVLNDKSQFVDRWPQRQYLLRDGADINCTSNGLCTVVGLVDWRNYSAARKSSSEGVARFMLTFQRRGNKLVLVAEASTVLTREVRRR
jgi:hypothetical protein